MSATRRRGQAPVRADQGPVVPQREGLPALPEDLRPDRGGPALPRQARTCSRTRSARRSPRAAQTSPTATIEDYYNENEQQFEQPERRDVEVIKTKTPGPGAGGARSAVEGGESWSEGRQGPLDRPRLQGTRTAAARRLQGPAGGRSSTRRSSPPCKNEGRRPGQDRRRLLRLPGDQDHARPQAEPRPVQAGHQAAARLAEPAEEARQLLHATSATTGASAPTAPRTT